MLIDGRQLEDNTLLKADIAIIGAGAAGITLARELINSGKEVLLIESGGLEFEQSTQDLYEGSSTGVPYSLTNSRLRYFGGSTNHWGGWCRPLTEIDFEKRDWVEHSGWPITRADLEPFYARAVEVCQIYSMDFDKPDSWTKDGSFKPLSYLGQDVITRFFLYSPPTRFGQVYREVLEQAQNVRVLLHSNVLEILPNEALQEVEELKVATLSGRHFKVQAKRYVLATGGIENARMLLASNSRQKTGLGNGQDLVGRFFMEHPHLPLAGGILLCNPEKIPGYYHGYNLIKNVNMRAALSMSDQYLRDNQQMNTVFTFSPWHKVPSYGEPLGDDWPKTANVLVPAMLKLMEDTQGRNSGPDGGMYYAIGCGAEQEPNPDSRVTLSTEKDALGMPRTQLAWRLSQQDRRSLRRNLEALGQAFGASGEGRVMTNFPVADTWEESLGGNHHMGTTRMADSPNKGVVDANCQVFGINNLYIAGSSVFTTCGTVNPTLTIVALALRLADRLRSSLQEV